MPPPLITAAGEPPRGSQSGLFTLLTRLEAREWAPGGPEGPGAPSQRALVKRNKRCWRNARALFPVCLVCVYFKYREGTTVSIPEPGVRPTTPRTCSPMAARLCGSRNPRQILFPPLLEFPVHPVNGGFFPEMLRSVSLPTRHPVAASRPTCPRVSELGAARGQRALSSQPGSALARLRGASADCSAVREAPWLENKESIQKTLFPGE